MMALHITWGFAKAGLDVAISSIVILFNFLFLIQTFVFQSPAFAKPCSLYAIVLEL